LSRKKKAPAAAKSAPARALRKKASLLARKIAAPELAAAKPPLEPPVPVGKEVLTEADKMAAKQRDISVSEFFLKNRHLLGFDNPKKALLTTIKEAVDNSLDACEEA
jgi:DNA topoisomerase-6 subunit B